MNRRIIFTGGPGSGKTTTLRALAEMGYVYQPDVARAIIKRRVEQDQSPRPSAAEFAHEILNADIAQYDEVRDSKGPVFFDRGIPDALGMMFECGEIKHIAHAQELLTKRPYENKVCFFPAWEAIYRKDDERDQSFEEAVAIGERVKAWYESVGFSMIGIPMIDPVDRADWLLCRFS